MCDWLPWLQFVLCRRGWARVKVFDWFNGNQTDNLFPFGSISESIQQNRCFSCCPNSGMLSCLQYGCSPPILSCFFQPHKADISDCSFFVYFSLLYFTNKYLISVTEVDHESWWPSYRWNIIECVLYWWKSESSLYRDQLVCFFYRNNNQVDWPSQMNFCKNGIICPILKEKQFTWTADFRSVFLKCIYIFIFLLFNPCEATKLWKT